MRAESLLPGPQTPPGVVASARGETLRASLAALPLTGCVALGKSTNLSKPDLEIDLNEPMII